MFVQYLEPRGRRLQISIIIIIKVITQLSQLTGASISSVGQLGNDASRARVGWTLELRNLLYVILVWNTDGLAFFVLNKVWLQAFWN